MKLLLISSLLFSTFLFAFLSIHESERFVASISSTTCLDSLHRFQSLSAGEKLGASLTRKGGRFSIWLPGAQSVEVVGDFNHWDSHGKALIKGDDGVWRGEVPYVKAGQQYKYRITDSEGNVQFRIDPQSDYVVYDPKTKAWNGVLWNHANFKWTNTKPISNRKMVLMEVHPGTAVPGKQNPSWRDIAHHLIENYGDSVTHFSFMPVFQHNVYESWGYQPGAIFSPNFRHGDPDDFKYLVNKLQENGKGVILDVVFGHSSKDWDSGLGRIDGTDLYFQTNKEYQGRSIDMGHHPLWDTKIYDYSKREVQNYLLQNAKHWIENYNVDGFRVDAVASMLHLDYERGEDWVPNKYGDNWNIEAADFLRRLSELVHTIKEGFVLIGEDSSANVMTTKPLSEGGLGFDYIWGIGGMHEMREFLKMHPDKRNLFQIFSSLNLSWGNHRYIHYLNSHDEISHGKRVFTDLIHAASEEEKLSISRMMHGHLFLNLPGHPMLFQGENFLSRGWWDEWTPVKEYQRLNPDYHAYERYIKALYRFHQEEPALFKTALDSSQNLLIDNHYKVAVQVRYGEYPADHLIVVMNFGTENVLDYRVPVVGEGEWQVVFSSDHPDFGGKGTDIHIGKTESIHVHESPTSLLMTLPANSLTVLKQTAL